MVRRIQVFVCGFNSTGCVVSGGYAAGFSIHSRGDIELEEGTCERQTGGWTNGINMGFHMFFCVHVHTYTHCYFFLPILRKHSSGRFNSLKTILKEAHTHADIF